MGIRAAHGNGASALIRVETLPVDELPEGVKGPALEDERPAERRANGQFVKGSTTAQRKGGNAKRGKVHLTKVTTKETPPEFEPYKRQAAAYRAVHCRELARNVGGGTCGPGPSAIVASSALMLAWSRYLSDEAAKTGSIDMITKSATLADKARQGLLTAHELCAREAMARAKQAPTTAGSLAASILGEGK